MEMVQLLQFPLQIHMSQRQKLSGFAFQKHLSQLEGDKPKVYNVLTEFPIRI